MNVLSVDIGTSSLKAAFIDLDGRLRAFSRSAYAASAAAVRAESWADAFALALKSLYAQAPDRGIDAVSISGNGPTLVPVNREGKALPPLHWFDDKTVFPPGEAAAAAEPPESFFLPRAAWFKENDAAGYAETDFFLSSHEWLAFTLGAEALTVLPNASYEPYYWDDEQCRAFGLPREKFPPFVRMGSVMGHVSAAAAGVFGPASGGLLKSGIPIIAGGPDFITALIGTGTLRPGDVCDRAGSSEGINACAAAPVKGEGLRTLPHAKEGLWNVGALLPSSGRLFEQYRRDTGREDRPYEELLADLIPSAANPEIFLSRSPTDAGRAVLRAMGFAARSAVERLKGAGLPVKEMRLSGGQGKNARWNQLKADITGVPLLIPEICDGELAGNAVLSSSALGAARDFEQAAEKMIRIKEVFTPRDTAFWEEQYRSSLAMNPKMGP